MLDGEGWRIVGNMTVHKDALCNPVEASAKAAMIDGWGGTAVIAPAHKT